MGKKNRVAVICGWLMFVVLSPGYALGQQQDLISLKVSDVPFVKVLEEIRKQSGYNFMYNEKFTRNVGRITLEVKNLPLETVMEKVLKGTGLNFRIQDNIIILQENRVEQPRFRTLRGTVRDENGEPIPGVTVLIKGTLIGVSTAIDGSFTLDLPGETEVLQISFIGMETQEIKISPQMNELNVVMRPHISELEEVIVSTGYTQTAKWRATGSVAVGIKKCLRIKLCRRWISCCRDRLPESVYKPAPDVRENLPKYGSGELIPSRGMQSLYGSWMGFPCKKIFLLFLQDRSRPEISAIFLPMELPVSIPMI